MKKNILVLVVLLFLIATGATLECNVGYEISSESINTNSWNSIQCQYGVEEYCLRAEGFVTVFGFLEANVAAGICTNQSRCFSQSCNSLTQLFVRLSSSLAISLSDIPFEVNTCDFICCTDDNCNNNTVADIRELQEQMIVTTNADTTTITEVIEIEPTEMTTPIPATEYVDETNITDGAKRIYEKNTLIGVLIASCAVVVALFCNYN